jgi:hypothetical protein
VNRSKNQPFIPVYDVMMQYRARIPARPAAPAMRLALPGERPPSRYARGADRVIEAFDAYAKAVTHGR